MPNPTRLRIAASLAGGFAIAAAASVAEAAATAPGSAAVADPPRILREPLFGLTYDQAVVQFDRLPSAILAPCSPLADNPNIRSHWFIYAHVGSYYIAGGYSIRSRPRPPDFPEYVVDAQGVAFRVERGLCKVYGNPGELLAGGEAPTDVVAALLSDSMRRLVLAFGGEKQLRKELHRQHISRLPAPLEEAIGAVRRSTGCTAPCAGK